MNMALHERGELIVHIEGIGWWSPGVADWTHAAALLRDGAPLPTAGEGKPAAAILAPNERRRAPAPVLLACEVAAQACTMAERAPDTLRCVFSSMHGDIGITDDLCTTLGTSPLQVSPTRFHNSVHNAPVGHWTVAAECHLPSNAVSALRGSFAAGLLESAVLACMDEAPVLFTAYDIAAQGALAGVIPAAMPFGTALVISPGRTARTLATLRLRHLPHTADESPLPASYAAIVEATPIANGLPLFSALARSAYGQIQLPNGVSTSLSIEVTA